MVPNTSNRIGLTAITLVSIVNWTLHAAVLLKLIHGDAFLYAEGKGVFWVFCEEILTKFIRLGPLLPLAYILIRKA